MSKMLSVIIPVFNAKKTLAQAVESVFEQKLRIPFEIVIVDDGSTDGSKEEILRLAAIHKEIRFYLHSENRGGGTARNTAVFYSRGDKIFCLDSDDMLGENMLQRMVDMLETKKCDGVGIHISKKFIGNDTNRIAYVTKFGYVGKQIPFESLFENSTCSLYSTFLITKKAFELCGGYPTDNGFDTQSMAFRFLANGLVAYTCPEAQYWHRVNHSRSYYIREYEAGRTSENWMKIFEEFFFLFSAVVQKKLLSLDMENGNSVPLEFLKREQSRFAKEYRKLLRPRAKEMYEADLQKLKKRNANQLYWLGIRNQERGDEKQAVFYFLSAIEKGLQLSRVHWKMNQSIAKVTGKNLQQSKNVITKVNLFSIRVINDSARIVRRFI